MSSIFDLKVPPLSGKLFKAENDTYKKELKKIIVTDNIDINSTNRLGNPYITEIIKFDNVKLFKYVVGEYNIDINQTFNTGEEILTTIHDKFENKKSFQSLLECTGHYYSWKILDYLLDRGVKHVVINNHIDDHYYGYFNEVNILYYATFFNAPAHIVDKILKKFTYEENHLSNPPYDEDLYFECLISHIMSKDILKIFIHNMTKITKTQIIQINKLLIEFDEIKIIDDKEGISSSLQKLTILYDSDSELESKKDDDKEDDEDS